MSRSLRNVLEYAEEAAVLEECGRVAFANAAARRLMGEECVGRGLAELLGEEVAETQAPSFVASVPRGERCYIVRATRVESGRVYFISGPGEVPALLNEPFLYQLRRTIMNMSISLDLMRQQAEDKGEGELLTHIRGLTRSYYQFSRLSYNAAVALNGICGRLSCDRAPVNLSCLCSDVLYTVQSFCGELPLRADLGCDIVGMADADQVTMLLLNLLSNCLIHAGAEARISVSLSDQAGNVVLAVDDDGPGIAEELLPCVFNRYDFPFSPSEVSRGPGLGLTAARLIAAAHEGVLLLESRAGRGTTVRVCLGKRIKMPEALRQRREGPSAFKDAVLTGLADILPEESFSEKYAD